MSGQVARVFRARLARYDRPASSLEELLRAEGDDFVHFACWTVLGRRAKRAEHEEWVVTLTKADGKQALLYRLYRECGDRAASGVPSDIRQSMMVYRLSLVPWVGGGLAFVVGYFLKLSWLRASSDFIRRTPGRMRWLYRHSRKAVFRLAARLRLPHSSKVRRVMQVGHAPVPEGVDARTAELYTALCVAVDRASDVA